MQWAGSMVVSSDIFFFRSGSGGHSLICSPLQTAAVKLPKVNPGNVFQLGGEFVVTPGYECSFAHRMTNLSSEYPLVWENGKEGAFASIESKSTRADLSPDHMEAADVLRIAGIDEPIREEAEPVQLQPAQIVEAERLAVADADWRAKRDATLEA